MTSAALGFRLLLGLIFLRVGLAKMGNRTAFTRAVQSYRLAPAPLSEWIGRWLPILETALGVLLVLGIEQRLTGWTVTGLLILFGAAVSVNLVRGRAIDCGCSGGTAPKSITWWTVARNGGLTAMSMSVATNPPTVLSLESLWRASGPPVPSLSTGLATVDLTLIVMLSWLLAKEALRLSRTAGSFQPIGRSGPP
ncbi:MAG: DoxX family protein [Actinomycetota bacterium]|nr:DoxX family protein [Actinomycetota bacterium]